MRKSLKVLTAVPCLLMASVSFANGGAPTLPTAQPAKAAASSQTQSISYVEIIQLNSQTQVFRGRLVDVRNGKTLLDVSGKGTQLQDFQKQSAALAPRTQTVSIMGPLATTSDVIVHPPVPPGPTGDDLIRIANQMAQSYEAIQPVQYQLKPNVLPPSKINTLPPESQPATQPAKPVVRP